MEAAQGLDGLGIAGEFVPSIAHGGVDVFVGSQNAVGQIFLATLAPRPFGRIELGRFGWQV